MNYKEFLVYKKQILENNPQLINCAENDLYSYFSFENKYKEVDGHVNGNIHRCHLVEDWLNYYSLSQNYKKFIGVSDGVRHSLGLLVEEFAEKKWLIPKDVYPFYQSLIQEKETPYSEYRTLGTDCLFIDLVKADILLITYPLKPLGRDILDNELWRIKNWLSEDSGRRLVIDAVYLQSKYELNLLMDLFKSNQVYILFSLSKSWCLPNTLGITFIPEQDLFVKEVFKTLKKTDLSLNLAYQALNLNIERPSVIKNRHKKNYLEMKKHINLPIFSGGYFFYLRGSHNDLLSIGIFTIPASVFGGSFGSVVSTLIDK